MKSDSCLILLTEMSHTAVPHPFDVIFVVLVAILVQGVMLQRFDQKSSLQ